MSRFLAAPTALLILASAAPAATVTWSGQGNDNFWSTGGNWVGDSAPVTDDDLVFTGSTQTSNTPDIQGLRVNAITFDSGADAFNILAGNIQLADAAQVSDTSPSDQSISASLSLVGDATFTTNDQLSLMFIQTAQSGTVTVDQGAGDTVLIQGGISGGASINQVGDGTLVLAGNNSFTGGVTIDDGTVEVRTLTALGTGTLTLNGGTLQSGASQGGFTDFTLQNDVVVGGDFALDNADGDDAILDLAGDIDLGGDTRTITALGDHALDGVISNGGIVKEGEGILILAEANTFAGGVTVSEGTLGIGNDEALGTGSLILFDGVGVEVEGDVIIENAVVFGDPSPGEKIGDAGVELGGDPIVSITFSADEPDDGDDEGEDGDDQDGDDQGDDEGDDDEGDDVDFDVDIPGFDPDGILVLTTPITLTQYLAANVEEGAAVGFTGGVSGIAGIFKAGDGVLLLDGANTYTGDTVISGGILYLAGTLTDSEVILSGGQLLLGPDGSVDGDLNISDNGGLNANPDGGTIDNDLNITGDMSIGGDGDLTIAGDLNLNNAVRQLEVTDPNATATITSGVSGNGGITKAGAGTLVLSGTNTYTGGTAVGAGTLRIDGSVAGTTTITGGTLALGSNSAIAPGGTLVLGGGNLAAAGGSRTLPSNITLQVTSDFGVTGDDDLNIDADVDLPGDAAITTSGTGATTIAGAIGGAGGLTKAGSGELILTGNNTYAGTTVVSGGTLRLNGSVASDVQLPAGILAGNATIGGDLDTAGGSVSPGNSVGTVVVAGNFNLGNGSTLEVEIDTDQTPIASDLVDVGGSATLDAGSTIQVVQLGGTPIPNGHEATVITTVGGVTDNGATVTDASAFFDAVGSVVGNDYILTFTSLAAFEDLAVGRNNAAIAAALDADLAEGENDALLAELQSFGEGRYNRALSEISPQSFQAPVLVQRDATRQFHNVFAGEMLAAGGGAAVASAEPVSDPLWRGSLVSAAPDPAVFSAALATAAGHGDLPRAQPADWAVFARAFGVTTDVENGENRTGFEANTGGVVLGAGRPFAARGTVGVVAGYSYTDINFEQSRGDGEVHSLRVGPYLSYARDYDNGNGSFLDAAVTFGYHDNEFDRDFGAIGDTARSDYDAYDGTAYVGFGYDWRVAERTTLTPVGSVQYTYYRQEGFTEEGSSANLVVDSETFHSLRSMLGVRVSHVVELGGVTLAPEVGAMWAHEFMDDDQDFEARFEAGVTAFDVTAEGVGRDAAILGAGVGAKLSETASAFLRYDAALGEDSESHAIAGGVTLRF